MLFRYLKLALARLLLQHAGRGLNPQADSPTQPSLSGAGPRPDPIRDQIPFFNVAFRGKDGYLAGSLLEAFEPERTPTGLFREALTSAEYIVPTQFRIEPKRRRLFDEIWAFAEDVGAISSGGSRIGRPGSPRQPRPRATWQVAMVRRAADLPYWRLARTGGHLALARWLQSPRRGS